MSTIGSSFLYGLTLSTFGLGLTGPTGNTGSIGPTGATGSSRRGNTGDTGPNLVNITKLGNTNFLRFDFTQDGVQFSNTQILGNTGYAKVKLIGQSGGNAGDFHLLKSSLQDTLDVDGNFPVDAVTLKGFSTNTPDYIKFERSGEDPATILKISYNLINVGYIGISGGTLGNILQNLPGQFQRGITFTSYIENENAVSIQHNNVQEGVNICRPTLIGSNIAYWKIDPSLASVFYMVPPGISLSNTTQINGMVFFVKRPEYGNLSKGISLHFDPSFNIDAYKIYYAVYDEDSDITSGITFASVFSTNFDFGAITWQNDSYFCPSSTKFNVLNLISLGNRYLAIPAQYGATAANITNEVSGLSFDTSCYPFQTSVVLNSNSLLGGLCCSSSCSGTAADTTLGNCTGYFIPTKGLGSQSLCSRQGSCCLVINNQYIQTQKTYCDCIESGSNATKKIWHPFEGLKTSLSDFDCSSLLVGGDLGACCDGNGNCLTRTESDCQQDNFFFQGVGILCGNALICSGGSGGCCDSGVTCSNGITGETCLSLNKTYLGDQQYCQTYNCTADSIPCFQTIQGIPQLKQGDEFAGGIVAGLFNLKNNTKSQVWGHLIFSSYGMSVQNLNVLGSLLSNSYIDKTYSRKYNTVFDYGGYGFTSMNGNLSDENESFMIIVAKNDITINNNNEFIWSEGQVAWGPLFDPISNTVDESSEESLLLYNRKEGFIFSNSTPSASAFSTVSTNSITNPSHRYNTNDPMVWIYDRKNQSINGKWSRNYGLMNTARIIGAKKAESIYGGQYVPSTSYSSPTIADAIQQFNISNPSTNNYESSWFIPSHDEMGFLSNLCQITTDFNLNSALSLTQNSSIINGTYWTSTGTFNLANTDGYSSTDTIPTRAWTHTIDSDNPFNLNNNYSIAASRQNTYKIRPIKIVRCDARFIPTNNTAYRVWRLPNG